MIIDCEMYMAERPLMGRVLGVRDLVRLCDEAKVDRALVMPEPITRPRNEAVAEVVRADRRFEGIACFNPNLGEDAPRALEVAVKEWGFRGLKLMPTNHGFRSSGPAAHPLMKMAQTLRIPVTVHSGSGFAHPLEIAVLAAAFPKVPVLMDHMGYRYNVQDAIYAAKQHRNLYLLTTLVAEPHVIHQAVQALGADRVIFGSNGPHGIPAIQIAIIRRAELRPADERKVLGDNAARLYGLTGSGRVRGRRR